VKFHRLADCRVFAPPYILEHHKEADPFRPHSARRAARNPDQTRFTKWLQMVSADLRCNCNAGTRIQQDPGSNGWALRSLSRSWPSRRAARAELREHGARQTLLLDGWYFSSEHPSANDFSQSSRLKNGTLQDVGARN